MKEHGFYIIGNSVKSTHDHLFIFSGAYGEAQSKLASVFHLFS